MWAKTITYPTHGVAMEIDAQDNVLTVGNFTGSIDLDMGTGYFPLSSFGGSDIYVAKYDNNGNFIWGKQFGGTNDDYSYSISLDRSGNIVITGIFKGNIDVDPSTAVVQFTTTSCLDAFIVKLDPLGNFIWAKRTQGYFLSDASYIFSTKPDSLKNIYLTGIYSGTVDLSFEPAVNNYTTLGVQSDIFIMKLDSNGNSLWRKIIKGDMASDVARTISIDSKNNPYIAGILHQNTIYDHGATNYSLSLSNMASGVILKLNQNGDFVWLKELGTDVNGLSFDGDDNILSTGRFNGGMDFDPGPGSYILTAPNWDVNAYISKLDSSGNFVWAKYIWASTVSTGTAITTNTNGDVITAGTFSSVTDLDPGTTSYTLSSGNHYCNYLSVLKRNGDFNSGKFIGCNEQFPYKNQAYVSSVKTDSQGNIFMLGSTVYTSNFDPAVSNYTVMLQGNQNTFLVKYGAVIPTSIKEEKRVSLDIFPNPTNGKLVFNSNQTGEILLYNSEGSLVKTSLLLNGTNELDLTDQTQGIYFIEVKTSVYTKSYKIVKQ